MDGLYLYGLMNEAPRRITFKALGGGRLQFVRTGRLVAAIEPMSQPPRVTRRNLRRQDVLIRSLAAAVGAILPARFGTHVRDMPALKQLLKRHQPELLEALRLVKGRRQMTLRVFSRPPARGVRRKKQIETFGRSDNAAPTSGRTTATSGPGIQHLLRRARVYSEAAHVPELEWLRPVLAPFIVAERVQRHDALPLIASVYHLIPTEEAPAYVAALKSAARHGGARVVATGPWPPYAFAPPVLA